MTRFTSAVIVTVLVGVYGTLLPAQDSAASGAQEVAASTGTYTGEQAGRGESAYAGFCLNCHTTRTYTGETFRLAWLSRTAFDVFDMIRSQMPEDNPGMLPRQDYADIVAYLLSLNGYPSGPTELPSDDAGLRRVRIDEPPPGQTAVGRPGRNGGVHTRLGRGR